MIDPTTITIEKNFIDENDHFQATNECGEIIFIPFDPLNRHFQEIKAIHEKAKGQKPTNFDFSDYEL